MTTPGPNTVSQGRQLTLKLVHDGQAAAIVLGARGAGEWTDADAVTAWRDAAWGTLRMLIADTTTCIGAVGRNLENAASLPYEVGAPANPAGGQLGARAVAAACTLIKWQTNTGGRSGKGRTFLPGLLQGFVTPDGRGYTSAYQTSVATAVNNYLGHSMWAAEGLQPAVLSSKLGTALPIVSGSLAGVIGMQRRRMRG